MAETTKSPCTGNCMACAPYQRQYCASQIAYSNMGLITDLIATVEHLAEDVKEMRKDMAAKDAGEELINPIDE